MSSIPEGSAEKTDSRISGKCSAFSNMFGLKYNYNCIRVVCSL